MVFQVPVVQGHFNSQKDLEVSYADVHHHYQNPFWGTCTDPVGSCDNILYITNYCN